MFEFLFELLSQTLRAKFEKNFHNYRIGRDVGIDRGTKIIYNNKKNKGKLAIGDNSWIGKDCLLDITSDIIIGKNVQLAPRAQIYTHDSSRSMKNPKINPVIIEDNVYIGAGAIILCGVKLGKNSIIGAGTVVREDVPEGKIIIGNPMKIIK